jgi:cobyrinic acid a,c-diamide synthase
MIDKSIQIAAVPRIVIAAPASGSGKSTLATGLMAAFARYERVQGFKVGPDYIDPMYHSAATKRPSRNLDTWMTTLDYVQESFARASRDADIAIIEGVMGLFDGFGGDSEIGSTAQVAKLIKAPVILVLDVGKMARSAGAQALGYRDFDPDLNVAGVICNNVASQRHAEWVSAAITGIGLPVLGCLPRSSELCIPERHLGLHTAVERESEVKDFLAQAARLVEKHIDLAAVRSLAQHAQALKISSANRAAPVSPKVRIAIADDEAFCFYYEDNLELLQAAGAEIVPFSPLHDEKLPQDIQGIYFGGGYPELYADELSQNHKLQTQVLQAHSLDMPIYAECGGLMVLTQSLSNLEGKIFPMFGLVPGNSRMLSRLKMGYRHITAHQDSILLPQGGQARGHEFHYSDWLDTPQEIQHAFDISPRTPGDQRVEGIVKGNLLASYIHLHFGSQPEIANTFVNTCHQWKKDLSVNISATI